MTNPSFDRSKYKATSAANLKRQEEEVKEIVNLGNSYNRAGYHSIDQGKNKHRIYPARNPEDPNSSFIVPKSIHFLPQLVEETDDRGNKKDVIKWKPVFNSRVHGKTKKDICEEYIKMAEALISKETKDPTEFKKRMAPVNGYKDKTGTWHAGITGQTKWVSYSDKYSTAGKKIGFLEVTNGVKENMNKLTITEQAGEPIEIDPFSDADDGICLIIDYNKQAQKASDYYKLSLEEVQIDKFNRKLVPTPLTDEDIEKWLALESLEDLFVMSYKKVDFKKALAGLQIFDEQYNIGVWAIDEWHDIIAEIESYYPEIVVEEGGEKNDITIKNVALIKEVAPVKETPINQQEEKIEELCEEGFDLSKLDRNELKLFIHEEKLGISVKPNHTEDQIRFMITEVLAEREAITEESQQQEKFPPKSEVEKKEIPIIKSEDRVKKLRESLKNKTA
jgi:hypothetical protein